MSQALADEIRRIGFNTEARVGERRLHVQTEVLRSGMIRTTVLESGTVRMAESQPCPELSELDQVRDAVESQHMRIVGQVNRGEVG